MITKEYQIAKLKAKANIEIDRDIYSINTTSKEININGDWSIKRNNKLSCMRNVINAITEYCTKSNIEWEYNSTYSAWCD